MKIEHQFLNENYFIPNWEVKFLFIGTFNPNGGEKVKYFYGRKANYLWNVLSKIFEDEFNPYKEDKSKNFFKIISKHGIACVDLIKFVDFDENKFDKSRILGKGYKDSSIINTKVERSYNTEAILNLINKYPNIKVFSTWGRGSNLKEWKNEVEQIPNLVNLVSPSRAAKVPKGERKFDYIINKWAEKIKIL